MKSSNFIKIMSKYLYHCNGNIQFLGNANMLHADLHEYMDSMIDFEHPDAYSKVRDSLCIIEHFEFDSTKATSKGSKSKVDIDRIERSIIAKEPTEDGVFLHDSLNVHHNTECYIGNALHNMKNHYTKIDSYIQTLCDRGMIDKNTKLEIGFFIEDTTLLGNIYVPEGTHHPRPIILAHCKQFLDLFEDMKKLDFCFCASTHGTAHYLWFINRASIQNYRVSQIDLHTVTIIDFHPQAVGFNILVSSGKTEPKIEKT